MKTLSSAQHTGGDIVGRSAEREAIAAALTGARGQRGEILLLCGEPGIGKSTLALWAADRALEQDLAVHWGVAWEAGGAPSYWPWIQLLRSLLADPSARSQLADRSDLRAPLAQLLPELEPDRPSADRPDLRADEARFRLMETVRALLQLLAADSPFVLILEDLHATDADSLQLLHYVARHRAGLPFVLIGTFREVEARTSGEMAPLWQAARHARLLRLARMNEAEVREFVARCRAPVDEAHLLRLLRTSEGNPLFLAELVDLTARRDESGLAVPLLPDTLAQVIRQQLDRLPAETRELLELASTLGRDFAARDLAQLAGLALDDVTALLEPALRAEVVRPGGEEAFRFAHILIRDALHQGQKRTRRETLHRRRAEMLRSRVERGEAERWPELAMHLQEAGRAHRPEAVAAWRRAAQHARERLALEAAVDGLARALELFGEGPGSEPEARCELLLELADATLVKGDIEAGRARCAEAYRIARVLEQPQRMARAALTYGRAFVVAKVDHELVTMLRETLERLPAGDSATRARITARLAAALQPAPEPAIPMDMAREAIALGRATGEELVLYDTLRSAISALMDFAPPDERIVLNREYTVLAERFHDVPEQFRGNLRRMIDALELADLHDVDVAIEVCDGIARRLEVPHYAWKVAACRAMRAMMCGEFAEAEGHIGTAERLASRAGDQSARMALPIQRFGLLRDFDPDPLLALRELQPELVRAIVLFPFAEPFVMTRVASFLHLCGEHEAARSMLRSDLVARALASGDRSSLCAVGEIAFATNDRELARQVYDTLSPHREHCSHWGLMGMLWDGPVAYVMGLLATSLGRPDEARALFEQTLGIAERMRARPLIARTQARLAELALERGEPGVARALADEALALARALGMDALATSIEAGLRGVSAQPEAQPAEPGSGIDLSLEGDVWRVGFRGRSALVRQSRGMRMLHTLVSNPRREFHVLDLQGDGAVDPGDAGPALDDRARAAYREQLVELESDLALAEEMGDLGRAERLRGDVEILTRELSRAFGLGGRARPTGSAAERARVNVQRRLRDAQKRIGAHLPDAERYLNSTVRTGTYCSFEPL